jgi:hypothetical protein
VAVDKIILSHKRAGKVTTHTQIAGCKLCIPEAQVDAYEAAYPNVELVPHPDDVIGLWAKREWVRTHHGDHVQLDDDMVCIFRLYRPAGGWKRVSLSPSRAAELIDRTCETAEKLGAFLFGFGQHAHPLTYNALRPFRFGGYTPGGCLGLREGSRLWWPTDLSLPDGDDFWICLLNAHLYRYSFFDRRFAAGFRGTFVAAGGLQEFRDQASWDDVVVYLQKMFGSDVVRRDHAAPDRATKRIRNPSRRSIVLPYGA